MEIENLNQPRTSKEVELVIKKSHLKKKAYAQISSLGILPNVRLSSISHNLLQKIVKEETFPNSFWGQYYPTPKTRQGLTEKTKIPQQNTSKANPATYKKRL